MPVNRVLFVDDEASQRLTLPAVLRIHGFEVCTAATVAEALASITSHQFDILISDLNIGEPGDGFTVVSAMHRTQPDCINFIVTGFPAFESALAAIQRQVDEVFVKPARVESLVEKIQEKLHSRNARHHPMTPVRLSTLLREGTEEILQGVLCEMKSDSSLAVAEGLSDEARAGYLSILLREIAEQMDSSTPDEPTQAALALSRKHGARRSAEGYTAAMLVAEMRIVEDVVYDIVRQRMLLLDTTNLVSDLKRMNASLCAQLQEAVMGFWNEVHPQQEGKKEWERSADRVADRNPAVSGRFSA